MYETKFLTNSIIHYNKSLSKSFLSIVGGPWGGPASESYQADLELRPAASHNHDLCAVPSLTVRAARSRRGSVLLAFARGRCWWVEGEAG